MCCTIFEHSNLQASGIHARDRSDEEYATSPTPAKLSIEDCTEVMIQQLCTLCHVDFELLRWLGFRGNHGNCNEMIS
jgi:hypothetical protein